MMILLDFLIKVVYITQFAKKNVTFTQYHKKYNIFSNHVYFTALSSGFFSEMFHTYIKQNCLRCKI
jgi:hypothetical protein